MEDTTLKTAWALLERAAPALVTGAAYADMCAPGCGAPEVNGPLQDAAVYSALAKEIRTFLADAKPRYQHDCEECVFLGQYAHHHVFDLYVCPRDNGLGICCIARWDSNGASYSSMSLLPEVWDASLAAIKGPRQSMYHCAIPELCEAWARWKCRQESGVS